MNNCFSIYHTSWITSGPNSNFIRDNIPTKAILFFFGCAEVNSTWLITSELANQRARKVLFTCVVYTNIVYSQLNWWSWPQSKGKTPCSTVVMRLSCQLFFEWLRKCVQETIETWSKYRETKLKSTKKRNFLALKDIFLASSGCFLT